MQQGISERDTINLTAGKWGKIEKSEFRQTDIEHAVVVPALQALIPSIGAGITVGFGLWFVGTPAEVASGLGLLVGLIGFTVVGCYALSVANDALAYSEVWESESRHSGEADSQSVRIELVTKQSDSPGWRPGDRMENQRLAVDPDVLAMITRPSTQLSKRGLMAIGLDDMMAMQILAQLEGLKYIARNKKNEPAYWTARGQALCRAFGGGGGGGGEPEVMEEDPAPVGVGEFETE